MGVVPPVGSSETGKALCEIDGRPTLTILIEIMAKANFTCVPSIQPIHQISRQHSSPRPPPVELEFSRHQRNVGPPDGVVGPERHYIKISLSPRIFKRI